MVSKDFQSIFNPRTIAVIGASGNPSKFSGRVYLGMKGRVDDEKIYIVNPNITEINDEKTYACVQDIDDNIDFAIIVVSASRVVQAVRDCAEKNVRAVEILSAGFAETGLEEGALWEREIIEIARESGMRIIGPNCFGVYSPESPLTLMPGSEFSKKTGSLGIFAQSGGVTTNLCRSVLGMGMRISKAISYGNAIDMNEIDFLSYFGDNEQTRIVAGYIEGVSDGKRFLDVVKRVTTKKPVIIWKGGLTHQGSRAVSSHTASLAGSREIWEGFFHQTGAIPVRGTNEMLDLVVGFHCAPDFQGRRFSIVSGRGGIAVEACDALEKADLSILPFSDKTQQTIQAHLPPQGNSVRNPVDTGSPMFLPKQLKAILEAIVESDRVDAIIIEQVVNRSGPENRFNEKLAGVIHRVGSSSGKPIIIILPPTSTTSHEIDIETMRRQYWGWYLSHDVPVFNSFDQAANALGKIISYNEMRERRQK